MISAVEVKFPGWGINVDVNPVAFHLGSIDVYWYGLLIAIAIILSVFLAVKQAKSLKFPEGLVYDTILMIIPCAIIGARAYYVIFNYDEFKGNFKSIFDIRSGGLAIYGGVLLVFIGGLVMCRIRASVGHDQQHCRGISGPLLPDTCCDTAGSPYIPL